MQRKTFSYGPPDLLTTDQGLRLFPQCLLFPPKLGCLGYILFFGRDRFSSTPVMCGWVARRS